MANNTWTPAGHNHEASDVISGVIAPAQLGTGSPTGSKYLRDDGVWTVPPAGGSPAWGDITGTLNSQSDLQTALNGKVSTQYFPLIVPIATDPAGFTWTNMPAAVTFLNGSYRFATKVDLSTYTQTRLIVNKQGTAGAASAVIRLRYIAAFNTTVGNWLTIGSSEVQCAVNVTNTVIASSWIDLVAGAKADVFLVCDGSGGDGVLDPVFGNILAEFR